VKYKGSEAVRIEFSDLDGMLAELQEKKITEIRVENDVVFVKAKNYRDFDLAIAKLLMVALRIKI